MESDLQALDEGGGGGKEGEGKEHTNHRATMSATTSPARRSYLSPSPPRKKIPLRNNYVAPSPEGGRKRSRAWESPDRGRGGVPPPKTSTLRNEEDALPSFMNAAKQAKAKFDLLPILASSGETVFEVGLNPPPGHTKKGDKSSTQRPPEHLLPVFRLPAVTSTDFINRIPRSDNDMEKELRRREEEEFEVMKQKLGLSTAEILEMEHLLGER